MYLHTHRHTATHTAHTNTDTCCTLKEKDNFGFIIYFFKLCTSVAMSSVSDVIK